MVVFWFANASFQTQKTRAQSPIKSSILYGKGSNIGAQKAPKAGKSLARHERKAVARKGLRRKEGWLNHPMKQMANQTRTKSQPFCAFSLQPSAFSLRCPVFSLQPLPPNPKRVLLAQHLVRPKPDDMRRRRTDRPKYATSSTTTGHTTRSRFQNRSPERWNGARSAPG